MFNIWICCFRTGASNGRPLLGFTSRGATTAVSPYIATTNGVQLSPQSVSEKNPTSENLLRGVVFDIPSTGGGGANLGGGVGRGEGVGLGDGSGGTCGRVGGEVGMGAIGYVTDGSDGEGQRTNKPIANNEPTIKMMMVPIDMKMAR